jgi:SET domain-containing protein
MDEKCFPFRRLYIKDVPGKGKGVFSMDPLANGDLIECCPTIKLTPEESVPVEKTVLEKWLFVRKTGGLSVALGFGSLYNHSFKPNAQYIWNEDETIINIVAVKDIPPHTEIVFNYHWDPNDMTPIWFECVDE